MRGGIGFAAGEKPIQHIEGHIRREGGTKGRRFHEMRDEEMMASLFEEHANHPVRAKPIGVSLDDRAALGGDAMRRQFARIASRSIVNTPGRAVISGVPEAREFIGLRAQATACAPVISTSEPHMKAASSDARKATSAATSSGLPIRPKGTSLSRSAIVRPDRFTPASSIGV